MKIHELKILPKYFEEVVKGDKTFELRKNDRGFEKGDILLLKEWDPNKEYFTVDDEKTNYSGKKIVKRISSVLNDIEPSIGLKWLDEFVILSIKDIETDIELEWKSDMNEWGEIYCPFLKKNVMTYYPNGCRAYDTITNPFINQDGVIYYYQYDHDEGGWWEDIFMMCDAEEYINLKEVLWY